MKKIIFTIFILLALACASAPLAAFAADEAPPAPKPTAIPCIKSLPCISEQTQQTSGGVQQHVTGTFATAFFKVFLGLSAVTSVIFIIVGGMQMHLAFGKEEAITSAKKTLIWAIAGLIISMLAVGIVQIVSNLRFG